MAGAADDDEEGLPSLAPQWLKEGGALGAGSSASRIVKSSPAAEEPPPAVRLGEDQTCCCARAPRTVCAHCPQRGASFKQACCLCAVAASGDVLSLLTRWPGCA